MKHLIVTRFFLAAALIVPATSQAAGDYETTQELTVRKAVEQALQNNLNLKLARQDTEVAGGGIEIAESSFDKTLSANAGVESQEYTPLYTGAAEQEDKGYLGISLAKKFTTGTEVDLGWSNNRYDSDQDGLTLNPSYGAAFNLDISQPLLKGWGTDIQTAPIESAQASYDATVHQVDSTAADLAAQVKNGYWNLVFAWQDISVSRLSLELAIKLLEETEAKIAAGKLAQVEVYQPQSEVARREEELITAERAIGTAEDNLKLLMNANDWLVRYEPVDEPRTDPVHPIMRDVLDQALANRPDLKAAELTIRAAQLEEKLAQDNTRPSLNLVGGLDYGGTDDSYDNALSASTGDPDLGWQVGLTFSHSLDNSYARGALRQARAKLTRARTNSQLLQLEITRSVRTTVRDVELAIKAMEATRKTSIATRKRLEAEEAKFEAGRSTTLDVLAAQEAYSRALSQENRTKIVYVQSLAELDRIQGLVSIPD